MPLTHTTYPFITTSQLNYPLSSERLSQTPQNLTAALWRRGRGGTLTKYLGKSLKPKSPHTWPCTNQQYTIFCRLTTLHIAGNTEHFYIFVATSTPTKNKMEEYCIVYMATIVRWTRHEEKLYVNCLPCYNPDALCLLRGTNRIYKRKWSSSYQSTRNQEDTSQIGYDMLQEHTTTGCQK